MALPEVIAGMIVASLNVGCVKSDVVGRLELGAGTVTGPEVRIRPGCSSVWFGVKSSVRSSRAEVEQDALSSISRGVSSGPPEFKVKIVSGRVPSTFSRLPPRCYHVHCARSCG